MRASRLPALILVAVLVTLVASQSSTSSVPTLRPEPPITFSPMPQPRPRDDHVHRLVRVRAKRDRHGRQPRRSDERHDERQPRRADDAHCRVRGQQLEYVEHIEPVNHILRLITFFSVADIDEHLCKHQPKPKLRSDVPRGWQDGADGAAECRALRSAVIQKPVDDATASSLCMYATLYETNGSSPCAIARGAQESHLLYI
ncbi:hypothetical protein CALVIDRAFT_149447 [Calocera viscosa TUFC12733]|uniref:Uncharacterized protein n=1 Tax=Calocera viscosa (strain TUFC12733) TaxID=1330018 RepID=A0A167LHT3_CALVF|nr:hypothetical protein CALVIDRAFT_149447 [Calocera viscosa TUFC12733]